MNTPTTQTTRAFTRIFSILLAAAVTSGSMTTAQQTQAARPKWAIVERYALNDRDKNKWDDVWEKKYPGHNADPKADFDGDGIDAWTEMLDGTDPTRANKPGEIFVSAEEKARQVEEKRLAQEKLVQEWPAKQAELVKTTAQAFDGKAEDPDSLRHDNAALSARMAEQKAQADAGKNAREQLLDSIASKYTIPRTGRDSEGRGWTLVGESVAGPLKMTTQNAFSANSIRADDLWPSGLHSWQDAGQSRNLTGSGVSTSIFEAEPDPGVRTTHSEFAGRASQTDGAPVGNHATAVANVIAGGGVLDVIQNSTNYGKLLRGVAYQSNVRGHDLNNFVSKTSASVTDGHRFSNHSYGLNGGWYQDVFLYGGVPTTFWVWNSLSSYTEDPRFGAYTSTSADNVSSEDLDAFVASSLVQLPVFASGNPNYRGPGSAPSPFHVVYVNGSPTPSTTTRDWVNGDDGYDTVLSPGTAKNVLTVGSILDVVGSTIYLSDFSGTGPTDDGRIKPDVVAVGQRNTAAGAGASLFVAHAGSNTSYYNGVTPDSGNVVNLAGTSFAAPQVTGALALAQQRRAQLFPTAGAALASTWRALSIHAAQDIGSAGPDFAYGWGIFDAVAVVERVEQDATLGRGSVIKEFDIAQGVSKSFYVTLPANTAGKLTLAWTDPAGDPPATDTVVDSQTKMLVNDIDIKVENLETSTTHYPWTLNPDLSGESAAVRGQAAVRTVRDSTNNVERVDIDATSGARTLKVTISPFGTITGGTQKVSLVLSGVAPLPPKCKTFGLTGNPNDADEMAFTFENDPGAFFTLQVSSTLMNGSWSDVSSALADGTETTLLVSRTGYESRFWRVRRGQ